MANCQSCKERIEELPFHCRRCYNSLCSKCRLPEDHNCEQLHKGNLFSDKKRTHHKTVYRLPKNKQFKISKNHKKDEEEYFDYHNEQNKLKFTTFKKHIKQKSYQRKKLKKLIIPSIIIILLLLAIIGAPTFTKKLQEINITQDTINKQIKNFETTAKNFLQQIPILPSFLQCPSFENVTLKGSTLQIVQEDIQNWNLGVYTFSTPVLSYQTKTKKKIEIVCTEGVEQGQNANHYYCNSKQVTNAVMIFGNPIHAELEFYFLEKERVQSDGTIGAIVRKGFELEFNESRGFVKGKCVSDPKGEIEDMINENDKTFEKAFLG